MKLIKYIFEFIIIILLFLIFKSFASAGSSFAWGLAWVGLFCTDMNMSR